MPPAAMSMGCTCWRTIRSTSASSARAEAAGSIAAASTDAAITAAAITRIVLSRPTVQPTSAASLVRDCSVLAEAAELIRVHVIAAGLLLTVRPRESGDPELRSPDDRQRNPGCPACRFAHAGYWIPACAGMSGGETRGLRELGSLPHTQWAPAPLRGRVGEGGDAVTHPTLPHTPTPTPNPSPQPAAGLPASGKS